MLQVASESKLLYLA